MNETAIQAAKFEVRYNFKESNRHDFHEHMHLFRKHYKLMENDQIIYYTNLLSGRVIGKVDSLKRKFYIAEKK